MFAPKQPQGAMRCPVCIKGDDPRRPIVAERLAKELFRGLDVTMLAQAKVDRLPVLVHSAVQVNPFTHQYQGIWVFGKDSFPTSRVVWVARLSSPHYRRYIRSAASRRIVHNNL